MIAEELESTDHPVSVIGLSRPLSDTEIRNLKKARPGDRFNLSATALAMLNEAEDATDERMLVAERHYYVSNSYNVLQIFFVCLPYRDVVLIAMLNQTFTERVTGLTAGIAHKVGRRMIADEIKAILRQVDTKVTE